MLPISGATPMSASDTAGPRSAPVVPIDAATRFAPHVLVYDPDDDRSVEFARLRSRQPHAIVTAIATRTWPADLATEGVDIAVVNLGAKNLDGLGFAAELGAALPWIETVFWYDERAGAPSAAAARSLGVERVIPRQYLLDWLEEALVSLTAMARARREHIQAERALPSLPSMDAVDTTIPLPEAERRFRETYLRRVLSESPSHTAAASRTGVPYTTFCSMIKKLNLR
jgi:hypothetical protein